MIKVVISGSTGKMGVEAVKAVLSEPDIDLIGMASRGTPLCDVLAQTQPNVVLDLTHPDCVFENAQLILEAGAHAVIGTTGLTPDQTLILDQQARSKNLGVLICPNFAIGAILMMRFAVEAAKYMPRVEIIEFHHDQKADAPSGTALKTADLLRHIEGVVQPIPIHSVRLPGYVAHQEVIFGGLGQTLSIRHDTISRASFMPGVILSIRKVAQCRGVVYGLEHVL